jgi:hypothetical protein
MRATTAAASSRRPASGTFFRKAATVCFVGFVLGSATQSSKPEQDRGRLRGLSSGLAAPRQSECGDAVAV